MMTIDDYFHVKRGSGGYIEDLNNGSTPLISAKNTNNGIVGFVDLEPVFQAPAITVERVTGQSFIQTVDFVTVPDDISVLIPKEEMSLEKIYYVASCINFLKWRFSYGRKLSQTRLKNIEINFDKLPSYNVSFLNKIPKSTSKNVINHNNVDLKRFNITELFTLKRGDFHALDRLNNGSIPTISRVTENNGITGYYEKPDEAEIYPKLLITVATTSGDAFVQIEDFMATDNVVICKPIKKFRLTTLFFIQLMINKEKWRYSYGRQCYKTKFERTDIFLPVKGKDIDEEHIEKIVKNCYGWDMVSKYCS